MKNRSGIVCAVALAAATASGPVLAQEEVAHLVREVSQSVVLLKIYGRFDKVVGTGSGFFVSEKGWIVTNQHVAKEGQRIAAELDDGTTWEIERTLASDEANDLAILQVEAGLLVPPALRLAAPDATERGARVVVIGGPLGLSGTVSEGIVAAFRDEESELPEIHREPLIQITAPISEGSSGSPVLNLRGEVIGVAVLVSLRGQNLNFAVPAAAVAELLSEIELGRAAGGRELDTASADPKVAYARNVGISLLFFLALYFGFRRLK